MIRLAKAAEDDLGNIDYWLRDQGGGPVADQVIEAILSMIERLERFPALGRHGRRGGTRELVIPRLPYVAVYRLAADDVIILRVMHGAQLWPPAQEDA